ILDGMCYPFTRDDLAKDPTLQKLCGCHMATCEGTGACPAPGVPASPNLREFDWQSHKITNTNQYPYTNYSLPFQCDPFCSTGDAITNQGQVCDQSVCIIDNTTVDLADSRTGNIEFNQVCSCESSNCVCYIANTMFEGSNSTILGDLDINQNCTSCYSTVPG